MELHRRDLDVVCLVLHFLLQDKTDGILLLDLEVGFIKKVMRGRDNVAAQEKNWENI